MKIKGLIKIIKDSWEEGLCLSRGKDAFTEGNSFATKEGKNFTICQFDILFTIQGFKDIPAAAVGKQQDDHYLIFVNQAYKDAQPRIKAAFMNHEVGHVKHGHIENRNAGIFNNVLRMFSQNNITGPIIEGFSTLMGIKSPVVKELEADAYAVSQGLGNALHLGLTRIRDHSKELGIGTRELDIRIDALTI